MRSFNKIFKSGKLRRLLVGLPAFTLFMLPGLLACGGNDDGPMMVGPTVAWSAATSITAEGGTTATIILTTDPAPAGDLNISIEISGSAASDDYTLMGLAGDGTSRTLTLPAGDSQASFTLTALNDGVIENDETVVFTLAAGSGYTLGSQSAHTATIVDDPFIVEWSAATSITAEGGTTATVTLTSDTAPASDLNLSIEISGSAASDDYTLMGLAGDGTSRTLTLPAGDSQASFTLTALNDGVIENDETVVFTLAAGSGYTLGSQSAHTATIVDDPFIVEWSTATSITAEGGAAVTVTLTSDTAPASDLNLSIEISGSATSDDYTLAGLSGTGTSRTLTLPAGDSQASFMLTALDDSAFNETGETAVFTLAAGTGYTPGSQSAHTFTITDTDTPFIVLWNSGTTTGDFGFDRCQNILADTTGIGRALRDIGFSKAIFFGSTPVYNFTAIATDPDALGMQTDTYTFANDATSLNVQVASLSDSMVSYTSMFGGSTRTLGNLLGVASGGGWQNGGNQVVAAVGITLSSTQFWSFTLGQEYRSNRSCNGGTSASSSLTGYVGNSSSIDGNSSPTGARGLLCHGSGIVLCLAR